MESLSMCRICLATDIRLSSIASHLQDMYERISSMTFERQDWRPLVACYICHARLQNCYRLRTSCLRSEEQLTEMMSSGVIQPQNVLTANTFRMVSVLQLSMGYTPQNSIEDQVKEKTSKIIHGDKPNQLYTKDTVTEVKEKQCEQIDNNNTHSLFKETSDVVKRESEDVETDATDKQFEEDNTTFDEENDLNSAGPSSQLANIICPKIVKIVLQRIDANDTRPGIPQLKQLTETRSKLIKLIPLTETENKKNNLIKLNEESHKPEINKNVGIYKNGNEKVPEIQNKELKPDDPIVCIHTGKKFYQCDLCKKCFNHRSNLRQHKRIHGEKPFQCEVCSKPFKRRDHLRNHMYTHSSEKQYRCTVCNKSYSRKCFLTRHIDTHIEEELNGVARLQSICPKIVKVMSQNNILIDNMPANDQAAELETGDENVNKSIISNKVIVNKSSNLDATLEENNSNNKVGHYEVNNETFKSVIGSIKKCYKSKANFESQNAGEKLYKCDVCKKEFQIKSKFAEHMTTHTVKNRCVEGVSGKLSVSQNIFERRYRCNVCKKCFPNKVCLTKHMYTHLGEKRYKCDTCKKCFQFESEFARHMYSEHNVPTKFSTLPIT